MEGSFLSPQEQKYYSELFTRYDVEKTGKLSNSQAMGLFLSSDVPNNTLKQISDLCGAERVGHYGRSQFFIALKLIALVQSGKPLPPSLDGISSGLEVPLPVFGENVNDTETPDRMEFENPGFIGNAREAGFSRVNGSGTGFPPPPQKARAGITSKNNLQSIDEQDGSSPQEYSPSSSPPASPEPLLPPHSQPLSSPTHEPASVPVGLPVASTPRAKTQEGTVHLDEAGEHLPLSGAEEGWAQFEAARSKVNQPTTDMNNSWATFPKTNELNQNHTDGSKVLKAEADTKEEEDEDDPWVITKEQKKYYTTQFQTLQPDLNSSIKGPDAKAFFEKSKLPTYELSQIWQLSDVNKDGTLYLEEFCTAMHLVVLRKHDISLPERLPPSLIPKIGRSVTPPSSESEVKPDENWATFQDSPFPGPPSPSSQTPVNFDFASISPDPDAGIFQPKPVHLAPDGKPLADEEQSGERPRTFSDPLKLERKEGTVVPQSPTKVRSLTHADTIGPTPTKIAPPPSAQKLRASNQIHSDGQDRVAAESGRPNRPLVPPRPSAQEVNVQYPHTPKRAYSMEDRHVSRTENFAEVRPHDGTIAEVNEKEGPPQLPPRPVLPEDTSPSKSSERHHSVDLEKENDDVKDRRRHLSAPASSSKKPKAKDRRAIQAAIRAAKEENVKLSRLNNELQQELSQLTEDRVGLEAQLQKLRPFHKINSS